MKNKFQQLLFISITFLAIIQSGCKKNTANFDSDISLFKDYIFQFTAGVISAHSPIEVELVSPINSWKVGEELSSDLFSISPPVKGKVIVLSNTRVAFKPNEKLKQHTDYQVSFNLGKIVQVKNEISNFNFTVHTIALDFRIHTLELQSYSKDWQYLSCRFESSDLIDAESVRKIISANQSNKKLKVKLSESTTSASSFDFIIDSISRQIDDTEVIIKWNGNSIDVDQKGDIKFQIPGKNNFTVIDIKLPKEKRNMASINFSDPLMKSQSLEGLVNIESAKNLTFTIEGNILNVFFGEQLKGNLLVEVFDGIKNEEGYKLKKMFSERITFNQLNPAVEFVKSGTILPSSSNLNVHFKAVNLSAIDVKVYRIFENNVLQFLQDNSMDGDYNLRKVALPIAEKKLDLTVGNFNNTNLWNTYAFNLAEIIKPQPGAIYRLEISFKKDYSIYECEEIKSDTDDIATDEVNPVNEDDKMGDSYDYDWSERDNPCSNSYFYNKEIATNILASDLGVIAKRGANNSFTIIVNNIINTEEVSGAGIDVYNFQQQLISSHSTKADGIVTFETKENPYFAVVKKDNNTTYVKLDDGYSQSISNFDVDGQRIQEGIKGYIYGERGVWRPGDSIFLGFILNDKANKLPLGHPIKLQISDPQGKVFYQSTQLSNKSNHYKFVVTTLPNSPTGNWEAMMTVGGAKFYKSLKIETIKPNRLKVKNSLAEKQIFSSQKNLGVIDVSWLHGAVGKELKAEIQAKFYSTNTDFKNYKDYQFNNPTSTFTTEEVNIFSGKTNENGIANYELKPSLSSNAAGMLKLSLITKVHENGGDFSTDVASATYSPFSTYIGLKAPTKNKWEQYDTDKDYKFDVVSVDENGNAKPNSNLQLKVYKLDWSWWWDNRDGGLAQYAAASSKSTYIFQNLTTDASGKTSFNFKTSENDWGRYLILVSDINGGHATGNTYVFDYPYGSTNTRNEGAKNASILNFTTDKKSYNVGEKAYISFPSSANCKALISVENGSGVLSTQWVKTKSGNNIVELPISSEMTPNVYIYISLLQPHSFSENDLPVRLYGVVPIEVINKNSVLQPVLNIPEVLRPEHTTNISISEKNGKAMNYTIALVDDGLLDLTRFKTPNAWDDFHKKEALGVMTWDIYDDIIGAFGGKIAKILSIGGDQEAGAGKTKKANRFKPMVIHLGPYQLVKGSTQSHTIKIPNYIGSVRAMVVASNNDEYVYGSSEKTVSIKSPLMVLASLPRKVSSGEKITLPITVFAMDKKVKDVKLNLKTTTNLVVNGPSSQNVSFSQPDEKIVNFEFDVTEKIGMAKVNIEVSSGAEKASYAIEIDITNPNPTTFKVYEEIIEKNSTKKVRWNNFGISGSNGALAELSSLPPINLEKRLKYLIQYPHGCIEQTTSSAFPQLFLAEITDLDQNKLATTQRNISEAIQRIASFQTSDGGFAYWQGGRDADDWGTSYAGHFLLEAEKKGFPISSNLKNKWLNYQKQAARNWRKTNYNNDIAQSYRLFTLALAGHTDLSAMNRLKESKELSNIAKIRLSLTYAMSGQAKIANTIIATCSLDAVDNNYDYYGSEDRNRALTLETLVFLNNKKEAFSQASKIAKSLSSSSWMSTQSTAYALLAMSKFAKLVGSGELNTSITQTGKQTIVKSSKMIASTKLSAMNNSNEVTIANNGSGTLFVRIVSSGILPIGSEINEERGLKVSANYLDKNGNPINVQEIGQGTSFKAIISITNTKSERLQNVALTQIIPSGWEIVNTRFAESQTNKNSSYDYLDIRDDRANYYFSLNANQSKTYTLDLNASYLGSYYLPGSQAEAMYDNNFFARTKGQWIKVVNPK
jgi:uncharacterized protein YfaS (alpha-2-macroglobulin family)